MSNQYSYHLLNGRFFSYFYPIGKYSKYYLNLTFCWEYNDTPSLKKISWNFLMIFNQIGTNQKSLVEFDQNLKLNSNKI